MTCQCPVITISPQDYHAVLFDLDGVLTRTVSVHAAAWKKLFDEFLQQRASERGDPFVAFEIDDDYYRYVDGKSRIDGVASFLESRRIELPPGTAEDGAEVASIQGLGSLKDRYFRQHLEQHGVETYAESIALVRKLRAQGIRTAVVSSSRNCAAVLEAAGIAALFDTRVDGIDIASQGLKGKPAPDAFLEAAGRIDTPPERIVVVEDALVGVEAGRAGGFGCVIGVDRSGQPQRLCEAGADVVVTDLAQVQVAAEAPSDWSLLFDDFDPRREGVRESLCTLGNGYFETRGAAAWAAADDIHYPGTYLAGGYNRLRSGIAGHDVESEDLVNMPNWLVLEFRIANGDWFDLRTADILSYSQMLDLQRGVLTREVSFADGEGRRSTIRERRIVSMADKHLAALELSLTAENWSEKVAVRSAIEGRIVNAGAKLYRRFSNRHLEPLECEPVGEDGIYLQVRTCQSHVHVAQAARTSVFLDGRLVAVDRHTTCEPGYIAQEFEVNMKQSETLTLEKLASFSTSRDHAISECGLKARSAIKRAGRFDDVMADHALAWKFLWQRFDVEIELAEPSAKLNVQMLLRLNMFHLLQVVSINSIGQDIGVPARGWTGEAYQGHIFWDELFIFPFFNHRMPEITRSLLLYRYRRLGEARAGARHAGYKGAMFPWQSGSNGREETQKFNLNPNSQRWMRDNTHLQRHVGSAIAYNIWQYYQVTNDVEFMHFYGAELIIEIARFWASIASFNEERQRYEIRGVMGPDEFHDGYPDSKEPGIDNNAYTNIMAVWVLCRAIEAIGLLSDVRREELEQRLGLSSQEISLWEDISRRMYVPFHDDGIISQFEDYEELREFDWQAYEARYGNIQRLDLIIEAENDSINDYKASKQADVMMLFYLFSAEELAELFERLGYPFEYETIPKNVAYYTYKASHGSTLSRVVNAWVLARSNRPRSMNMFAAALQSDVNDIQQGTTAEGIHLGAMSGAVDLVERVWTGLEIKDDVLHLAPELTHEIKRLVMHIKYRGHSIDLQLGQDQLKVSCRESKAPPIRLSVNDEPSDFKSGDSRVFKLGKG